MGQGVTGELSGRNYVVTGASMGIGLACAEELLSRGGRVLICARGGGELATAAGRLSQRFADRVFAERADVSKEAEVETLFAAAAGRLGRIDGVVHCAGIYGPIGPVTTIAPDKWLEAINVNLFGSFLVARRASQVMTSQDGGSIVLMSGGGAATPFPNYTAYACSKAGVVRLTETLAQELADTRIRVNCVAPGFVATRLHQQTLAAGPGLAGSFVENTRAQLEKGGVPPTVAAKAVAFLMSDRASSITGRFLAAPYDGYEAWPEHLEALTNSDLFTLRRIVPRDRGQDWQ